MIDEALLGRLARAQHQNQLALAAAIEELAAWVESKGGKFAAEHARNTLKTLDDTQAVIEHALAKLP